MCGLQAPNAGGWGRVKLYDYSAGDTAKRNSENKGCREVGSQKSCCTPLQNGIQDLKCVDLNVKIA